MYPDNSTLIMNIWLACLTDTLTHGYTLHCCGDVLCNKPEFADEYLMTAITKMMMVC